MKILSENPNTSRILTVQHCFTNSKRTMLVAERCEPHRYEEGTTLLCCLIPDDATVPALAAHLCLESQVCWEKNSTSTGKTEFLWLTNE